MNDCFATCRHEEAAADWAGREQPSHLRRPGPGTSVQRGPYVAIRTAELLGWLRRAGAAGPSGHGGQVVVTMLWLNVAGTPPPPFRYWTNTPCLPAPGGTVQAWAVAIVA